METNIWSSYKRKSVIIRKAQYNDDVNKLLQQHYTALYSKLVKIEDDMDTFNDTFLKLTYNYDPAKDFKEQFTYQFKLLKGAYKRDDKVAKYHLTFDIEAEGSVEPDVFKEEEQYKPEPLNIEEYANIEKSSQKAKKTGRK